MRPQSWTLAGLAALAMACGGGGTGGTGGLGGEGGEPTGGAGGLGGQGGEPTGGAGGLGGQGGGPAEALTCTKKVEPAGGGPFCGSGLSSEHQHWFVCGGCDSDSDCPSDICIYQQCLCSNEQIEEDVVAREDKTYPLVSQLVECQHSHSVTFTAAEFASIAQGESVTNPSTTTGQPGEMPTPHHHDATISCSPDADNDAVADDVELSMGTHPNDPPDDVP
ncbi:MAG: hypothetical protein IPG04_25115 [Polyangiaceae bacterium]|nr:hypothetical protein [Polyangiaceae bacterium]